MCVLIRIASSPRHNKLFVIFHQYTIFNIKKKITSNYPKSAAMGFFILVTQERIRNSRGEQAISVRATEDLLYFALQGSFIADWHNIFGANNV